VVPAPRAGHDDDDDVSAPHELAIVDPARAGHPTEVMSTAELDAMIPARKADYLDEVDDGWGPPGSTIPPPLLGAIPGVEGGVPASASGSIPIANVDSPPLLVAPPLAPELGRSGPLPTDDLTLRALEHATARTVDLIRTLEHAIDRDEVIAALVAHLAETHRRAGFFAVRAGELQLFTMMPRPSVMPLTTLRLDRPSTLQDLVATRLPYRGPMNDDVSRTFLTSALGGCPAEILLVPVALRERVVGLLFGEHRMKPTFDDQLALAARAAGMALERILKKR